MKIQVNYRAITVGIGVLVAILIALTLLIRSPKENAASVLKPLSQKVSATSLETFVNTALKSFPEFFAKD